MTNPRFDEAWQRAYATAHTLRAEGYDLTLVRDLSGRVGLIVDDRAGSVADDARERLTAEFTAVTGAFASTTPILLASELFEPDATLATGDAAVVGDQGEAGGRLTVMDHGVSGADWDIRGHDEPDNHRVTLYGFKGGVGRSTAAFMLAERLASTGLCVLVVDLDLESPGVGALLLEDERLPDFGLVDHIVEAAVGNEAGLDLVTRSRLARSSSTGEVWVAPAGGRPREGYDYLAKLNRVYFDLPPGAPGAAPVPFASRLEQAVEACERTVERESKRPDVVLLDSRAGIHDIAAVAITQLSTLSLLFAMDNPQTWAGYLSLFKRWAQRPKQANRMRERLKIVASFVPARNADSYLAGFRDRAQSCFAEALYDDAASDDPEAFNPGPDDYDAPHSPLPILFTSELVGLNPATSPEWPEQEFVKAAYRKFLEGAVELIVEGEG